MIAQRQVKYVYKIYIMNTSIILVVKAPHLSIFPLDKVPTKLLHLLDKIYPKVFSSINPCENKNEHMKHTELLCYEVKSIYIYIIFCKYKMERE